MGATGYLDSMGTAEAIAAKETAIAVEKIADREEKLVTRVTPD